jgi:hypothetical protein
VGDVVFDSKKLGPPLARKALANDTANFKLASSPQGKQFFRATFKPTPPVPGVVEAETPFIEHMVFDKIKQLEFQAFWKALKPKVGDALVSGRDFSPDLVVERTAISRGKADVEKLEKAAEFDKALVRARGLEAVVDDYLQKADKQNQKFIKRGEEYQKRLKDAKDKAKEAMKIAKELKTDPEFLKHLPLVPRNELLAALQKPPFSDEKKKAAKVLLSVQYLDPGFEKRNQERSEKLAETLKADGEFKTARDDWQQDSFTTEKRLKILKKAVDAYVVAFDIKRLAPDPAKYKAPKVVAKQPSLPFPDKTQTLGEYDHKANAILMNVHDTAFKQRSFEDALESAIHEVGHHQQSLMSDRLKKPPKMSETDPDFNQAQSFKLNDTIGGFFVFPPEPPPSAGKGDEYFTQPSENHSRITAAILAAAGIGK